MTDNRTTELCKLLDECGEHYVHDGCCVTWSYYSDPHTATESMDGTLIVTGLTPEQAIAATLGSEREKALEELVRDLFDSGKYFNPERYGINVLAKRARDLGIEVNL